MAVERTTEHDRVALQSETLYAVIGVVASSPDLDRVLEGVVDLLTEATDCHACFVYLRDGDRLRLRAASRVYAHLVGQVDMGLDEGLAGWVARNGTPEFIRERAMADPRMKYIAAIEEERFQSMVAVPIPARSGSALGTVVLHTEAPREFDEGVLTFLAHTASLVAGAIENARLYQDTPRRGEAPPRPSSPTPATAPADGREEPYPVGPDGVRAPLRRGAPPPIEPDPGDRRRRRARGALPGRHRRCARPAALRRLPALPARPRDRPPRARRRRAGGRAVAMARRTGHRSLARSAAPPRPRERAGRRDARRARRGGRA